MAESDVYWWMWSIAFVRRRCESGVVGVVRQGRLHSLGLVWRQHLFGMYGEVWMIAFIGVEG